MGTDGGQDSWKTWLLGTTSQLLEACPASAPDEGRKERKSSGQWGTVHHREEPGNKGKKEEEEGKEEEEERKK